MKRNCRIKITEKPKAPFFCSEVDRQCQVSNSGNKRGTGKLRAGLADPGRHTELAFEKSGTICCHGNRRKSMSPDRWETDNWAERRQEVHRKWKSDSGFLAVWFWSPPVRWNRGFFPLFAEKEVDDGGEGGSLWWQKAPNVFLTQEIRGLIFKQFMDANDPAPQTTS